MLGNKKSLISSHKHTRTHARTHAHTHTYTRACTHIRAHTHTQTHTHTHAGTNTNAHTNIHRMCVRTYTTYTNTQTVIILDKTCTHYVYMHAYTYIQTYTHTYTHPEQAHKSKATTAKLSVGNQHKSPERRRDI